MQEEISKFKVKLTVYNLDNERKRIKQKIEVCLPAPHVSHTRIEF